MQKSLFALAALLCAAACSSSGSSYGSGPNNDPTPTSPNTINANPALDFNPNSLTVTHGTSVTFVFGNIAHTVTFTTAGAPAGIALSSNTSVPVLFPTAGTFAFHCTIHPQMTGTITVQ